MTSRLRNAARVAASEYVNMPRQRVPGHTPTPPPPLIGPSGSPRVDAVSDVVNRAVEPFRTAPNPKEGVCGAITHYVGGALGILGVPFEMMDTGFAMLTAPIAALFPGLPAATLMAPHLGPPHTHTHPPSLVPPAPPVPLPSIGMVMLPGCVSVFHGGIPAARAGDLGMSFTCGTLAPPLDVYTGSSNTFIGGSRAARMTDITRHCNPASASMFGKIMQGVGVAMGAVGAGAKATAGDALGATMAAAQAAADAAAMAMVALLGKDPGLPPGYGVLMMGNPMVLIGGFPMPDLMEVLGALFKAITKGVKRLRAAQRSSKRWRNFSNRMHQRLNPLLHRLGMSRNNRRRMHRALCFLTGHPVDVATGNVLTDAVDLELPGPLPLKISRDYYSCDLQTGPFGNNWSFAYDLALLADPGGDGVVVRMADGRPLLFPPCAKGQTRFDRRERATLIHDEEGYSVRFADGLRHLFGPATPGEIQPLVQLRDRAGHKIRFFYDERGDLERIVDSSKRTLELERDDQGRIVEIAGPTPEGDGRMAFARYFYDRHGDLVEVHDALGQAQRYVYNNHLLVQETDRNGLSFYFEYDGEGAHARCLRTWGDGGIYDHKLEYDAEAMTTKVTDSLGATTTYHVGGDGMVHQIEDALGGVRSFSYNEWSQPITEIDELGGVTYHEYDDRGNRTLVVDPDGGRQEMAYVGDLLVRTIDPAGGWWQWRHDELGRLRTREGPDGSRVELRYTGRYLTAYVDAEGRETNLGYDRLGNINAVQWPDRAMVQRGFDVHGRERTAQDHRGAVVRREYDALGRLVAVIEPGGERRDFEYDGEGQLLTYRDPAREVHYRYAGRGWICERREGEASMRLGYDLEGQLTAVTNAQGDEYRFERDLMGEVVAEIDWVGRRLEYERDGLGQIVTLRRPSGAVLEWSYTPAGKLSRIDYDDGRFEAYDYRPDGALIRAENQIGRVEFERDPLARVLAERRGEHEVRSAYDRRGVRTRLGSSRGLDLEVGSDAIGRWTELRSSASVLVQTKRNSLGYEVDRKFFAGVRSRWSRDALGRPIQHQLWDGAAVIRDRRYSWSGQDRIDTIVDALAKTTTQLRHDSRGRLLEARREDLAVLRLPDLIGNLYKDGEQGDRRYGPDGRLLQSEEAVGTVLYSYDEDGRRVEMREPDGRCWRYEWDGGDRCLAVVRPDGERVEFDYDALGRRVRKRRAGQAREFLWDQNQLLHEWSGESDGGVAWISDPQTGAPMLKLEGERAQAVICDHLGTPVLMLDEQGRALWRAEPSPWGSVEVVEGEAEACPHRFRGQYEDEETGLYYNRLRYYDPRAGQYLSIDPIRLAGGVNFFAYVDDPFALIDPFGLAPNVGAMGDHELFDHIHDVLYRDKRATGGGGRHGLTHRIREQITGSMRPGSRGWDTHEAEILIAQSHLRDGLVEWERRGLPLRDRNGNALFADDVWDLASRPPPTGREARVPKDCS